MFHVSNIYFLLIFQLWYIKFFSTVLYCAHLKSYSNCKYLKYCFITATVFLCIGKSAYYIMTWSLSIIFRRPFAQGFNCGHSDVWPFISFLGWWLPSFQSLLFISLEMYQGSRGWKCEISVGRAVPGLLLCNSSHWPCYTVFFLC